MRKNSLLSLIAAVSTCSILLGFSPGGEAATAANLVTICLSATNTTQASKCTKWQYNIYSATAYIETYPQVSPGPKVWTDPAYQYILGSTITSSMGVKVCPTALTPGTTFSNASADPCPNNVLISASTVLPASSYAVAAGAGGIVVYQVSTSGVTQVNGSPFSTSGYTTYSPALDPTGQYLYAAQVFTSPPVGGTSITSFKMVNGVPQQLSNVGSYFGGRPFQIFGQITAAAKHVYIGTPGVNDLPGILILATNNGVLTETGTFDIQVPLNLPTTAPDGYDVPISFAVDPTEQFLYWYLSSTGGSVADTVAIYSLNFAASTATLVSTVTQSGTILLGAQ